MKKLSYALLILWMTLTVSSCFTPKSIYKDKSIPKPIDFNLSSTQQFFKTNKIYSIKLTDGRIIKLQIQEIKPSGVEGFVIIKNHWRPKNQKKRLEIPFERMADAKKDKFNPVLTVGAIIVPLVILSIITINSISVEGLVLP